MSGLSSHQWSVSGPHDSSLGSSQMPCSPGLGNLPFTSSDVWPHGQCQKERVVGRLPLFVCLFFNNTIEIYSPILLLWNFKMLLMRFGILQSKDFNIAVNLLSCHLSSKHDKNCYLSTEDLGIIENSQAINLTLCSALWK